MPEVLQSQAEPRVLTRRYGSFAQGCGSDGAIRASSWHPPGHSVKCSSS